MKAEYKSKVKTTLCFPYDEFERLLPQGVIPHYDTDGLWFETLKEDETDEAIYAYLEKELDVKISSVHIDDCDYVGVWIVLKGEDKKAGKQFVVKTVEEEWEDDYFVITAPSGLTEKEIERDIEMAKKYIWVAADFDEKMPDEQPNGYDEHFKEMFGYCKNNNGEDIFLRYLELLGYTFRALAVDFEVEW